MGTVDSEQKGTDGTGRLLKALYGSEKDNIEKALGGSDAQMLYDAAEIIEKAKANDSERDSASGVRVNARVIWLINYGKWNRDKVARR